MHQGLQRWVADLNRLYRSEPALHELDCEPDGFEWIDCNDVDNSVFTLLRKSRTEEDMILVTCNFTPLPRYNYRVGVPHAGFWQERLNGDATEYGGSGVGNFGGVNADEIPYHGHPYSIEVTLPPLAVAFFQCSK
jgi:1,4-alpha-glucan branching enzyme